MTKHPDKPLFNHSEESYGDSFNAHLLEQYKLYVQSAENVSARRVASNRYMLTLSAAIVALYGVLYANFDLGWNALMVPVVGSAVSLVWNAMIGSYADLNRVKFVVINELEGHLPAATYRHEWDLLMRGSGKDYNEVSRIESSVPWIFAALHGALALWIVGENVGVRDWAG